MNALNKIIEEILKQADLQAGEILGESRRRADAILEEGRASRTEWDQRLEESTAQECQEIVMRAESADRQNRRRALLEIHNQVVGGVIAEARTKIINLSDQEYFDFMFRLFRKNAQPLDGVIYFAPADYAKIPDGFLGRCKQIFPEHNLQISRGADNLRHGFIIQYGDTIQNCSIDDIFESEQQALRDKIYKILTADA